MPIVIEQAHGTKKMDALAILPLDVQIRCDARTVAVQVEGLRPHENLLTVAGKYIRIRNGHSQPTPSGLQLLDILVALRNLVIYLPHGK